MASNSVELCNNLLSYNEHVTFLIFNTQITHRAAKCIQLKFVLIISKCFLFTKHCFVGKY